MNRRGFLRRTLAAACLGAGLALGQYREPEVESSTADLGDGWTRTWTKGRAITVTHGGTKVECFDVKLEYRQTA